MTDLSGQSLRNPINTGVMGPRVREDDHPYLNRPAYGIDAVSPPSTAIAWPLT